MVKGPPRYVALVRQTYQAMSRLAPRRDFRGSFPNQWAISYRIIDDLVYRAPVRMLVSLFDRQQPERRL
jgi:hypothetical protein